MSKPDGRAAILVANLSHGARQLLVRECWEPDVLDVDERDADELRELRSHRLVTQSGQVITKIGQRVKREIQARKLWR